METIQKGNKQTRQATCDAEEQGQTNKQINKGAAHVGHRYEGWCNVVQSAESGMQCVRVCGKASELIGDGWRCVELSLQGHTLTHSQ